MGAGTLYRDLEPSQPPPDLSPSPCECEGGKKDRICADASSKHRGLYKDGGVALGVGVNVNQTTGGWDLSKLSADELATFESLALKADVNQIADGARERIIEKIERIIISAESGEK